MRYHFDGKLQFFEKVCLVHVADRPLLNAGDKPRQVHRGHEDERVLHTPGSKFIHRGKAVEQWNVYVTDDDVRLEEDGRLNELFTVVDCANHLKVRIQ